MDKITLFEYQHNKIRTIFVHGEIWFVGRDVCKALGIVNSRDAISRLNQAWVTVSEIPTPSRGSVRMQVIKEGAVYKLAFGSNKPEAERFTDWIAGEVIPQIRRTGKYVPKPNGVLALSDHIDTGTQKQMSKTINALYFEKGGQDAVIKYNTENCLVHTGQYPKQVREQGKRRGLKTKECSSAKEVLRHIKPECACSMSLADNLISEGFDEEPVREISQDAKQLFKSILNLGATPKELLQD